MRPEMMLGDAAATPGSIIGCPGPGEIAIRRSFTSLPVGSAAKSFSDAVKFCDCCCAAGAPAPLAIGAPAAGICVEAKNKDSILARTSDCSELAKAPGRLCACAAGNATGWPARSGGLEGCVGDCAPVGRAGRGWFAVGACGWPGVGVSAGAGAAAWPGSGVEMFGVADI